MNFDYFTEEQTLLRQQIRRFVEEEIKPNGDRWEQERSVPRSFLKKMGELGFLGIGVPEEYGGSGMDIFGWVVLAEELGRSTYAGVAGVATVHTVMASPHLLHAGNKQQLEKYMPRIVSGELLTAIAISEPDTASDVAALRTSARRSNGKWILNGAKFWISNGVNADLYFVAARTDPASTKARGISMFIVEKGMPGFKVGQKIQKMGFHSNDTAELIFEDCEVPEENLLGVEGKGFYALMENLQNERLILATVNVSEAFTALKLTVDYARERKTFGTALIERQAIRHRLAMLYARAEAGRQFLYHTASLIAQGKKPIWEVSLVKAYWGELINEVMAACLQFHGGVGYMHGSALERMYRDARLYSIGGGATEIMLEEAAKRFDSVTD
jgi:acyl-CoA dehydrogenase